MLKRLTRFAGKQNQTNTYDKWTLNNLFRQKAWNKKLNSENLKLCSEKAEKVNSLENYH